MLASMSWMPGSTPAPSPKHLSLNASPYWRRLGRLRASAHKKGINVSEEKRCSRCKTMKSRSLFSKCSKEKSGLASACKACIATDWAKNVKRKNAGQKIYRAKQAAAFAAMTEEERLPIIQKRREKWARDRARKARKIADYSRSYRAANKEKVALQKVLRKQSIKRATPAWADLGAMDEFRTIALMFRIYTGQPYNVDHIVPLRGKSGTKPVVCGLHWEENLTVIPAAEDRRKSNQIWPDMP